ncbi:GAF domain-containing protein [Actinoplanes sp. NPDC049548]|uniref:GAF domain-containing protein n=1 Tax=Actinoplanes sp. NPDC049548 TaxID=3155152 RepID=UPI00342BDC27
MPDDEAAAAGLLARLHLLLQAAAAAPGDVTVLELALAQAIAATGADSAVLGQLRDHRAAMATMEVRAGGGMHRGGTLRVGGRYPLTDAVAKEDSIWLSSLPEIRTTYPTAGRLWGRAFAAVPLIVRHIPVGAIAVIHDTDAHQFTRVERLFLRSVADLCAPLVANLAYRF